MVGFRDANTPNGSPGSDHAPFANADTKKHVQYVQVACKRIEGRDFDVFQLALATTVDYERMKSFVMSKCQLEEQAFTKWSQIDSVYTFADGSPSAQTIQFQVDMGYSPKFDCIRGAFSEAFVLPNGALQCGGDFAELDRMSGA
jgi:hypothetical protein